jgi:uncharacterized phiE125 gp8 family phage protein
MTYNHFILMDRQPLLPNSVQKVTASTTYCVSLDEIKTFCRLSTSSTDEDALLVSFIKAAESYAENYTRSAINRQQWQVKLNGFDGHDGDIVLPRPPLSTTTTDCVVSYVEDTTAGNTTSIASTAITVDYHSKPGRVYPSYDNDWPSPRDIRNAVTVTYYCGYSTPANVPDAIKSWVKVRVAAMYENRESIVVGSGNFLTELPYSFVDGLLDEFIVE